MHILDKHSIVELKLASLNILNSLVFDDIYTKENAAVELREVINYLDRLDQTLDTIS
ncbi:hypothetical protein JOC95_002028 [Bacillus tianshenii]|uniref:Uncharacterized protein n=1 Tax=Sutcliffiella tianshenii TaxID=1463404 RepID=A0ABS2NZT3_9BACI|nr:hypothetical protein [Bacillus tianshenii]